MMSVDPGASPTEPPADGGDDFLNDFPELYFAAKKAVLFYETREGRQALEAITDLRDALDHLMIAWDSSDTAKRHRELICAKEHLRRAAVEPLEHAVENRLVGIMVKYRYRTWAPVLFLPSPSRGEVLFLIERVQESLQEARERKNAEQWREALGKCHEGYDYCAQLDKLLPDSAAYKGRAFALGMALLGAVVGFVLSQYLGG